MTWRGAGYLTPSASGGGTVCRSFVIPNDPEWLGLFMGALQALTEPSNWQKFGTYTPDEAAQAFFDIWIAAQTSEDCGGGGMVLRQNPDNSCQLQQSTDGTTWTLAFDYSKCVTPAINLLVNASITSTTNSWNAATSNTQINLFAPTLTFVTSAGETSTQRDQRKEALCYASHVFVWSACETMIAAKQQLSSMLTIAAALAPVIVGLAIALEILTGGAATLLIAGIASAVLAIAGQLDTVTISQLGDTAIREKMACLMYQQIQTLGATWEGFQTAFDGAELCLSGDEIAVKRLLANMLHANNDDAKTMFNAFINALGDGVQAAFAGVLNATCVCVEHSLDAFWRNGTYGWQFPAGFCGAYHNYVSTGKQLNEVGLYPDTENDCAVCPDSPCGTYPQIHAYIDIDDFSCAAHSNYMFSGKGNVALSQNAWVIDVIRRSDGHVLDHEEFGVTLGSGGNPFAFQDYISNSVSHENVRIAIALQSGVEQDCSPCPRGDHWFTLEEFHLCTG